MVADDSIRVSGGIVKQLCDGQVVAVVPLDWAEVMVLRVMRMGIIEKGANNLFDMAG